MRKFEQSTAAKPKEALENYIHELQVHYDWYDTKQRRYKRLWQAMQMTTVIAGFGTSIVAALMHEESFRGLAWGRVVLVALPSIGALASTVLVQTKALELMALREKGRQAILYLISVAKLKYAALDDPVEISDVHRWLIEEVSKLSREQAAGFLTLAPGRLDVSRLDSKERA